MSDIENLIAASSLGTADAVAMRARTSEERAMAIVARSKEIAAEERGFARTVQMLRDDDRYRAWWTSLKPGDRSYGYWEAPARRHLADYLETVADLGGAG